MSNRFADCERDSRMADTPHIFKRRTIQSGPVSRDWLTVPLSAARCPLSAVHWPMSINVALEKCRLKL